MRRSALGSLVFFLLAPGTVAGLVPWWISGWSASREVPVLAAAAGVLLIASGVALLIAAFVQFVVEGRGTPAPVAPTDELVVGGLYRWVRNPMYLAVAAVIGGQSVLFASLGLLWWLLGFGAAVWTFVTLYEQPTLRRRFGAAYDDYCAAVPGWRPRRTPYRSGSGPPEPRAFR
jgi:protein-S-isoprenylcysteine O-methyltransferase Ste14